MMEKSQFDLLGWKVKDRVTGFTGVVTHIGLDLYGCVQAIVHPGAVEKGAKLGDSMWFDIVRLDKVGKARVMEPIPVKGITRTAGPEARKPVK